MIIPSIDELDGLNRLPRVLQTASEYGLELNLMKCNFLKSKIEFLGYKIENGKISHFLDKTVDVQNFPEPKSVKQILIILALAVAANGATLVYHPAWWPAASAYQAKDGQGNYAFGHQGGHPGRPSFHMERGDITGTKVGSYGGRDPYGNMRITEYVADHNGYRPNIRTSGRLSRDHEDAAGVKTSGLREYNTASGRSFFSY
ncbi:hypothetical protein AVEN_187687-1 [Araneus ventricosus]|uniref:Reverse transcriptase domain-containing protein n=1 Tax=Araneus ventricosus TaxID=182803 RepID=A0A4Y2TD80_ARAVE|nr:hypothetical protein AVEN_187687-1 [Araneus ventricosus]